MLKFKLVTLSTMLTLPLLPLLLATSVSAFAANMTKAEYKAAKSVLSDTLSTDKKACKVNAGNAKDICMEEAKGRASVARAQLLANYEPSVKHTYALRVTRADANYAVAKEKCDDLSGNAKDVCRKEAKSAFIAAKADAKLSEKTVDNNMAEQAKITAAIGTADDKNAQAQMKANADKRDAAYAVAKEKCEAFSSDAKTKCMTDAKTQYGKN